MERILECAVCGRRFVALRKDATTCSPRCRKQLSRTMATETPDKVSTVPEPVVTLPVTLPAPSPEPERWIKVPARLDVFGWPEEVVECAPEAAAHWDARAWKETR